ncbi:hypothetical protein D0772_01280 [Campylobacter lari]|nr:hypothetical protein [Campylobacter lari]
MTAYVHIGTVKTGTTSIQKFLHNNYDVLCKQGILYPKSFRKSFQHWDLVDLVLFCAENHCKNLNDIKDIYFSEQIEKIKEELVNKNVKVLFSSEGITRELYDRKHIKILKMILRNLGFKQIYILLYIRNCLEFIPSFSSQNIKGGIIHQTDTICAKDHLLKFAFDYRWIIRNYMYIFHKENVIVKLFSKNEFYNRDLLKDFIHSIGHKWCNDFAIPKKENESLNLLGIELQRRINKLYSNIYFNEISCKPKMYNIERALLTALIEKHFTFDDINLKFQPSKEIM